VRPWRLESVTRLSVGGKNVTIRTRVDLARASLAPNVPNTRDGVAVLTLIEGGATTTVVEIDKGINTLVITADQTGDRASRATLWARGGITRAEVALLGTNALVVVIAARPSVIAILVVIAVLVVVAILVIVTVRGLGWSGRLGGGRRGWVRVATE
jgi:hypothetical protein